MLDPIYNAFGSALAFFYAVVPNEGVAIILLTVSVMLVLFPLTAKSARSMLAMQRLQPEIKKLQAKHKGDRQKLNEEMMKLYQEHKVNPLGGCLPLVVGDGAERVAEEAPEAAEPAAPAKAAKPAKSARAAKPAPVPRQSPLGALRDLFRPPADGKAGGNNNTPAPKPKPAASKEPAGQRGGSNRAGQSRRRRRRSSNKKRKR